MRAPRTAGEWVELITAPVWFPLFLLLGLLVYLYGWVSELIGGRT